MDTKLEHENADTNIQYLKLIEIAINQMVQDKFQANEEELFEEIES